MRTRRVRSREYKVMLAPEAFGGTRRDLLGAAARFWSAFEREVVGLTLEAAGDLEELTHDRLVRFYDTPDCLLRREGYVFRERRPVGRGPREVTLKFRHPDRYLAQDRALAAKGDKAARTKLEEDVKTAGGLAFRSLFSLSATKEVGKKGAYERLADVLAAFPRLGGALAHHEEAALAPVGAFTARELVVTGARFRVRRSPGVDAECALIAWHDHEAGRARPEVVEFSFRYRAERERFTRRMAGRAYEAFAALQSPGRLGGWLAPESPTKTAFAYGLAGCGPP